MISLAPFCIVKNRDILPDRHRPNYDFLWRFE